jgi:hypothetical protein
MEGELNSGPNLKVRAPTLFAALLSRRVSATAAGALLSGMLFWGLAATRVGAVELPSVNADLGPCTADFTVTDGARKPLYNAKVSATVKYGFLGLRKISLEVGTNSDGKARVEGLPSKVRKEPLGFVVSSGDRVKTVEHYPAVNCNARYEIVLESH